MAGLEGYALSNLSVTSSCEMPRNIPNEVAKFRHVGIDKVTNGFIIEIGCKEFVGTNWETVAKQLGEYWKDPVAAEKKYCK